MHRDNLITTVSLLFLLGIGTASLLISFNVIAVMLLLAVGSWIWSLVERGNWRGIDRRLFWVGVGAFLLGLLRFSADYFLLPLESIRFDSVEIVGTVVGLPDRNGQYLDLQVGIVQIAGARGERAVDLEGAEISVRLPVQTKVIYGDRLILRGNLVASGHSENTNNLRLKWFRQRLWGNLENAFLEQNLGLGGYDLWWGIFSFRTMVLDYFSTNLAEPAASLVNGVLLGERGNIPEELAKAFQITGLTHILAISGFNITLIINLLIVVSSRWKKGIRIAVTIGMIAFFVVLTGASASVVRAAVMGVLFLVVKNLGRRVSAFKAILLSVMLIVIVDPRLLNFDISFQLSVLATMSLVFYSSSWQGLVGKGWVGVLLEGVVTTLAAQVITLPFMIFTFGTMSVISPIANVLIGPLVPLLMLLGVGVLLAGLAWPPLGMIAAGITQILVHFMVSLVMTLSKMPFAQLQFGQGMWELLIVYYLGLIILSRKYKLVPGF